MNISIYDPSEDPRNSSPIAAVKTAAQPDLIAHDLATKAERRAWWGFWLGHAALIAVFTALNNFALGWPIWLGMIIGIVLHSIYGLAVHHAIEGALARKWGAMILPMILVVVATSSFAALAMMRLEHSGSVALAFVGLALDLLPPILMGRSTAIAAHRSAATKPAADAAEDAVRAVCAADPTQQLARFDDVLAHKRTELRRLRQLPQPDPASIDRLEKFIERLRRDRPGASFENS